MRRAAIVSPVRTPVGAFGGALRSVPVEKLGQVVVDAVMARTGIDPALIEDVCFAQSYANSETPCVGRWIALQAGLPIEVPGLQIDRRCGGGLQSIVTAAMMVESGACDVVIAGGVESMSNIEYYTTDMRWGKRAGTTRLFDRLDRGRERSQPVERFGEISGMIETAENLAQKYGIGREAADAFAVESHRRAAAAWNDGRFADEVVPVSVPQRKGDPVEFARDEGIRPGSSMESLAKLRPIMKDGYVTAGNAAQQNDAAAACLIVAEDTGGDISRYSPPFYGPGGTHFGAPGEGDLSASSLLRMRGKKSLTLDLKTDEGKAIFRDLAAKSDVVVENMSEGTVERLGLGYDRLKADNPGLVFASINGFGEDHPYPGLKAMDIIVQALSGVMAVTGEERGEPTRIGISIADVVAANTLSSAILAALVGRGRTGQGRHVKVSMLDALASLVAVENFDVFQRAGYASRSGNQLARLAPFGLFRAKDGHVAIAAVADKWTQGLFDAMGRPELFEDPRFESRGKRSNNCAALVEEIEAWSTRLTVDEVLDALCEKRGVPAARMRTAEEVLADPHLRRTGAIQQLHHPLTGQIDAVGPGLTIDFGVPDAPPAAPTELAGASNAAVLGELLGMSEERLADLKARKVI